MDVWKNSNDAEFQNKGENGYTRKLQLVVSGEILGT